MQFIIDLSIHADVWKTCTCTNFIKIINSNFNMIASNLMIKWTSDVSDVSYLFLFEGGGVLSPKLLDWESTECYGNWCPVTELIALLLHVYDILSRQPKPTSLTVLRDKKCVFDFVDFLKNTTSSNTSEIKL